MKCGELATDKATLQYDGDELAVGAEVFVESEGEMVAAEDGEYVAEDKTIVVAEGKVTEIRIKEQPEEEVEISAAKQKFNSIKSAFEASYEEKIEAIAVAIRELGFDMWIIEAADTYAIASIWDEADGVEKKFRFDISFNEDGTATASNPVEVKEEYVPVEEENAENVENFEEEPKPADEPEDKEEPKTTDEKVEELSTALGDIREGIEQLTNAIAAIVTRVEELENKIKGLEEPAAEPAEEGEETEVKASRLSYLRK